MDEGIDMDALDREADTHGAGFRDIEEIAARLDQQRPQPLAAAEALWRMAS